MEFLNTLHILSTNLLTSIGALLAMVLYFILHRIFSLLYLTSIAGIIGITSYQVLVKKIQNLLFYQHYQAIEYIFRPPLGVILIDLHF